MEVTELPPAVLRSLFLVCDWCQQQRGPAQVLGGGGVKEWSRLNFVCAATLLQHAHEPPGGVRVSAADVPQGR